MAAPSAQARPSNKTIALAFGAAIGAAVMLVVVALSLRNEGSVSPATPTPVVDLSGIPQAGNVLGSPSAKVTLIEYADPQCPACRTYTETMFPTLVDDFVRTGKAATEFRGFPFIGPDSVTAYRFLLAAGEQNRLWNLAEALYRNQGGENDGWVTDDLVRRLAGEIAGLDVDRLFSDAQRADIVKAASGAAAEASASGIRGTPTFLVKIGDDAPYFVQFGSIEEMRATLDDALSG
ncbi:MAG TPA: thioredoxin domain-containing protein [Gaiellaceae bacterium]|nr:thioredoxin domain-containing protein [Gaiellaceae bacterium]